MADDIFREVDDDMRMERLRLMARRYVGAAVAVAVVAAAGVGGWQYHAWRGRQDAQAWGATYFAALHLADTSHIAPGETSALTPQQKDAMARLATLDNVPSGLRTLSRLERAALLASSGDTRGALALWTQVSDDQAADPLLRGLASLLWVQHQIDDGDPAVLRSRLATLDGAGKPWRGLAQESEAMLDLRQGRVADARRKLSQITTQIDVPEGLRSRAGGMLQTLNAAPS
ncbi:MAG: tetratricopeptide repeat protein [Gluconacetobacter sp.]|uniref:Tetratricopeptide repeat protein n=1 Tax=Gluconacetobacter dulcium TaxID=2729096 RepID=A0A7W4PF79_9PROT|nr:tetratricopeptide repeat protein [Gluconacetobacter dulcium]MBB2195937.1 tetratricopeptide repeat protein [Gluconacetobacter dulcium]